jgi:hypothetical protein
MARFKMVALLAVAFLTMLSLRHVWGGSKGTAPVTVTGNTSSSATPSIIRTPVLVELFTSESCSSCPPADALLQRLDRSQPVRNAELVVLGEHVDYWNDLGWKDPYSSQQFTLRQEEYARRFRIGGSYTPQMVVDGNVQLVGSDERHAVQAIESAAEAAKLPVSLTPMRPDGTNTIAVHIEAGHPSPSAKPMAASGQVWIAIADDSDQSNVKRGENAGRTLTHVAVVRSLTQVGELDRSGMFSGDAKVNAGNANAKDLRVVAIVQEAHTGRVVGVAWSRLPS